MCPGERFGFRVSGLGTRFFVLEVKEFVTVLYAAASYRLPFVRLKRDRLRSASRSSALYV